jgi:hypothetical protein
MLKPLLAIALLLFSTCISAQHEDNVWLFGTSSINYSNYRGYAYGNSIVDFSNGEPRIYYDSLMTLDFGGTNASICDATGKLMLYTNGMQVQNGIHQVVKGVDTIGYGSYWEAFNLKDFPKQGLDFLSGYNTVQGALILPWPGGDDAYAVFYHLGKVENGSFFYDSFMHSKIFMDSTYQNAYTLYKDSTILTGRFIP